MIREEAIDLLRNGQVEEWNRRRARDCQLSFTTLHDADLHGADLHGADFRWAWHAYANLSEANLSGAKLYCANLRGADLSNSNLTHADLTYANLTGATLHDTNFRGAFLVEANFTEANFKLTDFSQATVRKTIVSYLNLSKIQNLESCTCFPYEVIWTPEIVSGELPLPIVPGCDMPRGFINCPLSFQNGPFEIYSCFIGYGEADKEFANRLRADLQENGVGCSLSPHDIQSKTGIRHQMDEANKTHHALILVLSDGSLESDWIEMEIKKVRERENEEHHLHLFPIRLVSMETIKDWELFDAGADRDLATEIKNYYYIRDFSNWKNHDAYKDNFHKLLRDLKKA